MEALGISGCPVDSDSFSMYQMLQQIHDDCTPEHWKERLSGVASDFNLTMPETTCQT